MVFAAASARATVANTEKLAPHRKIFIDLSPAATGPLVVPAVNLDEHRDARNVQIVTCGGQATIPMVAAIAPVAPVRYGKVVASIPSKSAGPGTRANIDEFTETAAKAIEVVGGAEQARDIIVLNPADPPMIMRDTCGCRSHRPSSSPLNSVRGTGSTLGRQNGALTPACRSDAAPRICPIQFPSHGMTTRPVRMLTAG